MVRNFYHLLWARPEILHKGLWHKNNMEILNKKKKKTLKTIWSLWFTYVFITGQFELAINEALGKLLLKKKSFETLILTGSVGKNMLLVIHFVIRVNQNDYSTNTNASLLNHPQQDNFGHMRSILLEKVNKAKSLKDPP